MSNFEIDDKVVYGWSIGSHVGYDTEVYLYKGVTTYGAYILENPRSGGVFLAKMIAKVEAA